MRDKNLSGAREDNKIKLFSAFGLTIQSEIDLPDLFIAPIGSNSCDVTVRLTPGVQARTADSSTFKVNGDSAVLTINGVGSYFISNGNKIEVQPAAGVSKRDLRLYLLGSAFGALLHQRGIFPLHANAIEIEGRAVAFSGESGAGKSTLAAWFHDRGYRMISDDVCAITFDKGGQPVVQGGLPRLRLCRDALVASGRDVAAFGQSYDGVDKFDVPARAISGAEPVPLGAIYMLSRTEQGKAFQGMRRLTGVDAIDSLVTNTYRGGFALDMDRGKRNFTDSLSIARMVPIFEVKRKWDLGEFDIEASEIERRVLEALCASTQ